MAASAILGALQMPAVAYADTSVATLAHATTTSVEFKPGTKTHTVRFVNDSASPLTATAAIVPANGETSAPFSAVPDAVGEPNPKARFPISVAGWIDLTVTATSPSATSDATLLVAVRPAAKPGSAGQTVTVSLHSGDKAAVLAPDVKEWTITRVGNWALSERQIHLWWILNRLSIRVRHTYTIEGAHLPVVAATCPKDPPKARLASEAGDAVRVMVSCDPVVDDGADNASSAPPCPPKVDTDDIEHADPGDATHTRLAAQVGIDSGEARADTVETPDESCGDTVHLTFAGVDRPAATYKGTLRLGADEKSDVSITLHQREGLVVPMIVMLLGILLGLCVQRATSVTPLLRRQLAQLDRIPDHWNDTRLPRMDMDAKVAAKKAELRRVLAAIGREHLLSLKSEDPDLAKVVADINALVALNESWQALLVVAETIRERVDATQPPAPPGEQTDAPAVVRKARELLDQEKTPDIDKVADYAKQLSGQLDLIYHWDSVDADLERLRTAVNDVDVAGDREMQTRKHQLLGEIATQYSLLWEARGADNTSPPTGMNIGIDTVRKKLLELNADAGALGADVLGGEASPVSLRRPVSAVRIVRDSSLASGRPPMTLWRGIRDDIEFEAMRDAAEAVHFVRLDAEWLARRRIKLVAGRNVGQRARATAEALGRVLLAAIVLAAIAWSGLVLTWVEKGDVGSLGDLASVFVWGLLTPASLALLTGVIDVIRDGVLQGQLRRNKLAALEPDTIAATGD